LPWGYHAAVLRAIRHAEEKRGSPPYIADIWRSLNEVTKLRVALLVMAFAFCDLFKNDEILSDKCMDRLSVNVDLQSREGNETEYELFLDRFFRMYPTYVLD